MNRFQKAVLSAFALSLLIAGPGLLPADSICRQETLGNTEPPINLTHIFEGDFNSQCRPVGFHSRPDGNDPVSARVVRKVRENSLEVYEAIVEIRCARESNTWLEKRSTFFPDGMSRQEVEEAILNAYRNRTTGEAERFRGPSGRGFTIEGYHQNGMINTAYPIYQVTE